MCRLFRVLLPLFRLCSIGHGKKREDDDYDGKKSTHIEIFPVATPKNCLLFWQKEFHALVH